MIFLWRSRKLYRKCFEWKSLNFLDESYGLWPGWKDQVHYLKLQLQNCHQHQHLFQKLAPCILHERHRAQLPFGCLTRIRFILLYLAINPMIICNVQIFRPKTRTFSPFFHVWQFGIWRPKKLTEACQQIKFTQVVGQQPMHGTRTTSHVHSLIFCHRIGELLPVFTPRNMIDGSSTESSFVYSVEKSQVGRAGSVLWVLSSQRNVGNGNYF